MPVLHMTNEITDRCNATKPKLTRYAWDFIISKKADIWDRQEILYEHFLSPVSLSVSLFFDNYNDGIKVLYKFVSVTWLRCSFTGAIFVKYTRFLDGTWSIKTDRGGQDFIFAKIEARTTVFVFHLYMLSQEMCCSSVSYSQ